MAKKILIIDDEMDTLNLLATTLGLAGYITAKAVNGHEGILQMTEFGPDVIILDMMMPDQSGVEVLNNMKRIFSNPPPVVIFSARGGIEDMVEGMEAGAFKYLVKPVSRDKLLETVKSALAASAGNPQRR